MSLFIFKKKNRTADHNRSKEHWIGYKDAKFHSSLSEVKNKKSSHLTKFKVILNQHGAKKENVVIIELILLVLCHPQVILLLFVEFKSRPF